MLLKARHSEPRDALVSVAYALLGIYAVTVIAAALPLQLLQPAWIERVCGSLRGGVSFPLIALVFLVMAQSPRTRDVEPASSIRLRRLSSAVALGFVLMVPLQTWAGVQVVRLNLRAERQQLLPISRGLERIRLAESEEALLGALASLPGAPPNLSGSLREPLAVVRQRLIAEIEPPAACPRNTHQRSRPPAVAGGPAALGQGCRCGSVRRDGLRHHRSGPPPFQSSVRGLWG